MSKLLQVKSKVTQKIQHCVKFRTATHTAMILGLSFSSALSASTEKMPTVIVESSRVKKGYAQTETSMPMYSGSINNIPQVISIVPKQLMQDQGITTVSDALRNVAGISLAAGEAGNQGDNLTIRGFTARSDAFIDGMRDFGSYTRDTFNIEQIDVVKGPSSIGFGRGSTGGVIAKETKQAKNENITNVQFMTGTNMMRRATVDINRPIEGIKGSAFRLNMMTNDNQIVGRDFAENKRFGFSPTLAFGLGSKTRTTVNYLHQSENDTPDYGLPWIGLRPAEESDTKRSSYYGFANGANYLNTTVDMLTTKVEHDISEKSIFRQQIRFTNNKRDVLITEPKTTGLNPTDVTRNQIGANSTETMLDSQTSIQTKFNTGNIKHNFISGLELIRETSSPVRTTFTGVPTTSLTNPDASQAFSGTIDASVKNGLTQNPHVNATAETQAIYVNDTMSPHEKIDIILGGRIDRFSVDYKESIDNLHFTRIDYLPSIRSSFVYKPRKDASIYTNYGTSYNPSAESFALTATTQNIAPEKNETFEIGTKWGFFKNKLNTMFAIFQTTKTNARVTDPTNSLLTVNGGNQRVKGFEAQINGEITEKFSTFSSYAYMESEVIAGANTNQIGNPLANAPKHTLNIWGTYKLTPKFELGGGANAISERAASITVYNANGGTISGTTSGFVKNVPGYLTFNAMAKYQVNPKIALQLNIVNLTNQFYYDQIHPSHIVPGAGRTFLLTANIKLD